MQTEKKGHLNHDDIEKEIEFQMNLARVQARWQETADFALAMGTLLVFWTVGAVVFARIEGWTVGNGLYVSRFAEYFRIIQQPFSSKTCTNLVPSLLTLRFYPVDCAYLFFND